MSLMKKINGMPTELKLGFGALAISLILGGSSFLMSNSNFRKDNNPVDAFPEFSMECNDPRITKGFDSSYGDSPLTKFNAVKGLYERCKDAEITGDQRVALDRYIVDFGQHFDSLFAEAIKNGSRITYLRDPKNPFSNAYYLFTQDYEPTLKEWGVPISDHGKIYSDNLSSNTLWWCSDLRSRLREHYGDNMQISRIQVEEHPPAFYEPPREKLEFCQAAGHLIDYQIVE